MGEAKRRRLAALAVAQGVVVRTDVVRGAERCAWCGEPMKTLLGIASERGHRATDPGSVVICHHCTGLNWTADDLSLVRIDDEMRARFDPDDLADLDLAAEHMRKLKRARGEHAQDPRTRGGGHG